ncbi:MAG: hypothetical protein COA79_10425 [Planctomycetota bacterium]|nr:MAG: hypothetical protein COA79_10425 [Planctomycetota bacterium]
MKKHVIQYLIFLLFFFNTPNIYSQDFFEKKPSWGKKISKIKVTAKWEKEYVIKDETIHLALVVDLLAKHHVNSPTYLQFKEATKLGIIPIDIKIKDVAKGVITLPPIYPKPHIIKMNINGPNKPLVDINVYENKFIIFIPIKFTAEISKEDLEINLEFKYQICDDAGKCYLPSSKKFVQKIKFKAKGTKPAPQKDKLFNNLPKKAVIKKKPLDKKLFNDINFDKKPLFDFNDSKKKIERIKFSTKWEKDYAVKDEVLHLAVILEMADNHHVNPPTMFRTKTDDQFLIPTEIKAINVPKGVIAQTPLYPKPHIIQVSYDPTKPKYDIKVYEGKTIFFIPFKFTSAIDSESVKVSFDLGYQICDDRACYQPKTASLKASLNYKANESKSGQITDDIFKNIPLVANISTNPLSPKNEEVNLPLSTIGVIVLILMAIVGGLILNFTPCVLPVIPLKIMSLTNHSDSKKRNFVLGISMVAGIILFWLVMGGMIIGLKSFNSISELFQHGEFSLGIGVFIAIMAIGMCGLFTINVPQSVARLNPSFDSIAGSFGIGIMTAVLSTPCTAPFMGSAVASAMTQSPFLILIVFFFVGFGMALPYLILSIFPGLVSWLPKSGPSSVAIKQTMGIFMLAAACFFIGTGLLTLDIPENRREYFWWPTMLTCSAGGLAIFIFTQKIKPLPVPRFIFTIMGIVIFSTSIYLAYDLSKSEDLNKTNVWQDYTPALLEKVKSKNKIIIIDFTAVWCLNCKFLKKTVLQSKVVADAIQKNNVQLIRVDITKKEDTKIAFLKESGSITIPYLVILDEQGNKVFNSNFYTINDILKHINNE